MMIPAVKLSKILPVYLLVQQPVIVPLTIPIYPRFKIIDFELINSFKIKKQK